MKKIIFSLLLLVAMVPLRASQLTVADGTQQNMYVPMQTMNAPMHTQMIYPASMLTPLMGQYITELRFYSTSSNFQWPVNFTVRMGSSPYSSFSGNSLITTSELTQVLVGPFQSVAGGYVLVLDQPYLYNGGDLLLDITMGGFSSSTYFWYYGITRSNASCYFVDSYTPYTQRQSFLPKLTFTYGSTICGRPTALTLDSVGGSTATLHWNAATNTTGYLVTLDGENYPLQTDTSISFSGLVSNRVYTVSVSSICTSGDTLVSQSLDFLTVDTSTALWLPYFCDFETPQPNGLPTWWQRTDSCTTYAGVRPAVIEASDSYGYEGTHVLRFGNGCGPTGLMTAPLPAASRELHVSFWYMSTSFDEEPLEVGLVDSAGVFHLARQFAVGEDDDYYEWRLADFYTDTMNIAGPVRLAFHFQTSDIFSIDNLSIERVPYCPRPLAATVDSITATTARAHLTPADSGATMILSLNGRQRITTTDTVVSLSGLVPSQHYTLSVRTLSPLGDTSQALNTEFRTLCDSVMRLPWSEGFDDLAIGATHPCLTVTEQSLRSSYDPENPIVSGPGGYGTGTHSGSAMLRVGQGDQQVIYIATPIITTPANTLHVDFWYMPKGYFTAGYFQAGFQTSPTDTASFTPFYSSPRLNSSGEFVWKHVEIYTDTLSTALPDTVCFVLRVKTAGYLYIDDIEIGSTFNCPQPIDVRMRNVTSVSAELAWDASSEGGQYQVLLDGAVVDASVSNTHYLITGLAPQQGYTAAVRAVCSDGSLGDLHEVDFTTPCVATGLPIEEDFETIALGETLPACWTAVLNSSNYPRVAQRPTDAHSGTGVLDFWGFDGEQSLAQTPRFAFPESGLHIRFWESHYYRDSAIVVGLMTDVSDLSTMVPLWVFNGADQWSSSSWSEHEFYIDSLPGADTVCVAFFSINGASLDVDDLLVEAMPTCRRPAQPAVSQLGYDSVTIGWSGMSDAYQICYGTDSIPSATQTFTQSSNQTITLHGLSGNTTYYAWVRSLCGATDTSEWLYIGSFTTDCTPAPLPYYEPFDGYISMAEASCWSRADGWVDSLAYPGYALDYRYGSMWSLYNVYGSLAAMRVTLDFYDEHEWLISPLITVNDSAKLSFDIRMTRGMGESSPDSLSDETRFGVAFTADDGTSWQVLADWGGAAGGNLMQSMDSLNWHPTITLPAEAMGNIRLGFFVETGLNTDNVYLHLDNVKVEIDSALVPPAPDTVWRIVTARSTDDAMGTVMGGGTYPDSTMVTLSALPNAGYMFGSWNDNDTHAVRQIFVTSDTLFTASFVPIPDTFTVYVNRVCRSCGENIPADYVVGEGRYVEGDIVRLEGLVQGEGVGFDFWILETGDTIFDNPYSFIIHSDRIVTAYFSQQTGIDQFSILNSQFSIYPNPASTDVTVSVSQPSVLTVIDLQGRVVIPPTSINSQFLILHSQLAPGTYFLRIATEEGVTVKKLIMQ